MFWRILRQMVRAGRARLLLALVAVAGGAAVCTALLNIHFDAERKLAQEFATLGPNVVVSARQQPGDSERALIDDTVAATIEKTLGENARFVDPVLYVVASVIGKPVIVAGYLRPGNRAPAAARLDTVCVLGVKTAAAFAGDRLPIRPTLRAGTRSMECSSLNNSPFAFGDELDSQILVRLKMAQELAGRPGKATLIRVRVQGTPAEVNAALQKLSRTLPNLEVRPIRQIAEAEGQILSRIRGLIFATVAVILALTALCVLSATTALAAAHRRDVALMRALGGDKSRVLRLFLSEVAAIGVAGGALGWVAGIALSAWVGRQVFDAAITPRLDVLPLIVALMTAVALAGAFPLRLLSRVRPAEILRGE